VTLEEDREIPIEQNAVLQATTFPRNVHLGMDVSNLKGKDFKKLKEREKFILAQVLQVSERYYFRNKNALMLSDQCNFLVIRDFPLPPSGDWLSRSAAICIYFPKNYPRKAPVGFFIDKHLQYKGTGENHFFTGSGVYAEPDAFFERHKLDKKGYGFYCWRIDENWKPDLTNPFKPDNLDSFLKLARRAFDTKSVTNRGRIKRIY
jgi:hypothetical protein